MTTYDDLIGRARDKTRLRKTHGLTGWVLAEERLTDELADALQRQQQTIAQLDEWIAVLFDGYAVYGEIQHSTTLTPSDVSRVLDTVVAIARKRCAALDTARREAKEGKA